MGAAPSLDVFSSSPQGREPRNNLKAFTKEAQRTQRNRLIICRETVTDNGISLRDIVLLSLI